MKNLIKFLLVGFVVLALILPFLNLHAEETQNAKNEIVGEVTELVGELKDLKTNNEISDTEKDRQETALRMQALLKIANLALLEVNDLRNQLSNLKVDTDGQEALRSQLLSLLDEFQGYYEKFKDQLTENLTLENVKNLTKDFQTWRKNVYAKNLSLVSNFILIFNEKSVLKIADARLDKIIADLNKLDDSKLINKQDFQSLLKAAGLNLDSASLLNKKAEDLLFSAASGTISIETADLKIKYLAQGALKEIRAAYKNFIEISKRVRQSIGLQ